jgi:hypothetical protein
MKDVRHCRFQKLLQMGMNATSAWSDLRIEHSEPTSAKAFFLQCSLCTSGSLTLECLWGIRVTYPFATTAFNCVANHKSAKHCSCT